MPVIEELFDTPRLPVKVVAPVLVTVEALSTAKLPTSGAKIAEAWELAPTRQSREGQINFVSFISNLSKCDAN